MKLYKIFLYCKKIKQNKKSKIKSEIKFIELQKCEWPD